MSHLKDKIINSKKNELLLELEVKQFLIFLCIFFILDSGCCESIMGDECNKNMLQTTTTSKNFEAEMKMGSEGKILAKKMCFFIMFRFSCNK
jgi:hypothetical protein